MNYSPQGFRSSLARYARLFCLSLLILVFVSSHTHSQAVRGLKTVRRIDTAAFSIYYPPAMEPHAIRLAGIADGILEDLTSLLHSTLPDKKFPILISDISHYINGYFTPYPSNRIVLYLSAAANIDELSSFEDELRSVFLHELVHALTMNQRAQPWKILSWLVGDSIAPTAWIMPNALIEGTAVWAESLSYKAYDMDPSKRSLPPSGRLNDPGALEPVFSNLARGIRHDMWDVSGLLDYPGSRAYPYLYGALFVQFLDSRYGSDGISLLWNHASKGNIFRGFDGNLIGRGILGDMTGQSLENLWSEFEEWLLSRMDRPKANEPYSPLKYSDTDIPPGRFGPFALKAGILYYIDKERNAAFSLEDRQKPKRLFASDAFLESMTISPDGKRLVLEWAKAGSEGVVEPALYSYHIDSKALIYEGSRKIPLPGTALDSLKSGALPFLYNPRTDPSSKITYGLVRLGTVVLPARVFPEGEMEVLDLSDGIEATQSDIPFLASFRSSFEGIFFRSLAVDSSMDSPDSTLLALSCYTSDYVSRLGILEEQNGRWVLLLQKGAVLGGIKDPVIEGTSIVFISDGNAVDGGPADGSQTLRKISLDVKTDRQAFYEIEARWITLETWNATAAARANLGSVEDFSSEDRQSRTLSPRASLFPRLMSTTRYPYADSDSIGLIVEGSDLSERISFEAMGGWNFKSGLPEIEASILLSAGWSLVHATISDQPIAYTQSQIPARVSRLALEYQRILILNPLYRRGYLSAYAFFAGIDDGYELKDYVKPDYQYSSIGYTIKAGYSSRRTETFAPFDPIGFSFQGGLELEKIKDTSPSLSLSTSMTVAPHSIPIQVGIYGAVSLSETLRFLPAQRRFVMTDGELVSALNPSYPIFHEYSDLTAGSPWYLSGQVSFRVWNIEVAQKLNPIALPFVPPLAFRRATFRGGFRMAVLESASMLITPMSVFLAIDLNATVLAGIAAMSNVECYAEASYALSDSLPGGGAIYMDFGIGVSY